MVLDTLLEKFFFTIHRAIQKVTHAYAVTREDEVSTSANCQSCTSGRLQITAIFGVKWLWMRDCLIHGMLARILCRLPRQRFELHSNYHL